MNDLGKAQKALEDFLVTHPELNDYQTEISRRLSKAPTFAARVEILQFMMSERLLALRENLQFLQKTTMEMAASVRETLDETDWNG